MAPTSKPSTTTFPPAPTREYNATSIVITVPTTTTSADQLALPFAGRLQFSSGEGCSASAMRRIRI
jgi:hypothetical protein